jgi:hypothetical protein
MFIFSLVFLTGLVFFLVTYKFTQWVRKIVLAYRIMGDRGKCTVLVSIVYYITFLFSIVLYFGFSIFVIQNMIFILT